MTADQYLYDTKEINRVRELAMGVLHEPPAPFFAHQRAVTRIAWLLCEHVEARRLGEVAVAPVDVVLDHAKALIVQPDVIFVSAQRAAIIRDQVWGAPDLVVEVLSAGSAQYDRTEKLRWYRQYGVRECWLVDTDAAQLTRIDFTGAQADVQIASGVSSFRSVVLPELEVRALAIF